MAKTMMLLHSDLKGLPAAPLTLPALLLLLLRVQLGLQVIPLLGALVELEQACSKSE